MYKNKSKKSNNNNNNNNNSTSSNKCLGADLATLLSPVVPTKKFHIRVGAAFDHISQLQCLIRQSGRRNSAANIPLVHHTNDNEVNNAHLKILRVTLVLHVVCL